LAWPQLAIGCDVLTLPARAYGEVIRIMITDGGSSLQILNNQHYSFILRGNLVCAAARAKPPGTPRVENNIVLLDEKIRRRKSVQSV
jgi:hypothetical protein